MKKSVIGITLLSVLTFASLSFGETDQKRAQPDTRRGSSYQQPVRHDDHRRSPNRQRLRQEDPRKEEALFFPSCLAIECLNVLKQ